MMPSKENKMNKKHILPVVVLGLVLIGVGLYLFYSDKEITDNPENSSSFIDDINQIINNNDIIDNSTNNTEEPVEKNEQTDNAENNNKPTENDYVESVTFNYSENGETKMTFSISPDSNKLSGTINKGSNNGTPVLDACNVSLNDEETKMFKKVWGSESHKESIYLIIMEYCDGEIVYARLDEVPSQYLSALKELDLDNNGTITNREKAYNSLKALYKG